MCLVKVLCIKKFLPQNIGSNVDFKYLLHTKLVHVDSICTLTMYLVLIITITTISYLT